MILGQEAGMQNDVVLVVEDEPCIRDMMQAVLEGMLGVVTVPAENGREALRQASAVKPALVVLDIMMPEMDGLEVARRLKAAPETSAIPLIAVTALGDCRRAAFDAGCVEFIEKPFELDYFLGKVQKHLNLAMAGACSALC
jgi:CheY-like chemotaxis protein